MQKLPRTQRDLLFPRRVSKIEFVVEKLLFVDFRRGGQCLWFLNGDSQSKFWKLWTTLKRLPWFPWKPKICQETRFWTRFQKNFSWMPSEKGDRAFAGGGGGGGRNVPLPLVFGAQKKPGWDRVIKRFFFCLAGTLIITTCPLWGRRCSLQVKI